MGESVFDVRQESSFCSGLSGWVLVAGDVSSSRYAVRGI